MMSACCDSDSSKFSRVVSVDSHDCNPTTELSTPKTAKNCPQHILRWLSQQVFTLSAHQLRLARADYRFADNKPDCFMMYAQPTMNKRYRHGI